MKKIGFLVLILMAFFLVSCNKDAAYYDEKFNDFKKEKLETKYTDGIEYNDFLTAVREFLRTMSSRPSAAEMAKLITRYKKLLGDAQTYISDFDSLSREYENYKKALFSKISDLENDKNADQKELNKLKKENSKLPDIDKMQGLIKSDLDETAQLKGINVKDTILEWLENNQYVVQVLDLVANFCLLGGSVWIVLGTISLAGSLKDKNGPTLQTSIWQIVGGSMIMVATYLFRNVAKYPNLLNEVLKIAAKFTNIGGALWTIWGVLILASALKDKMGPALQTAIWQIVGGLMIIVASSLFGKIVTVSL